MRGIYSHEEIDCCYTRDYPRASRAVLVWGPREGFDEADTRRNVIVIWYTNATCHFYVVKAY